MTRRAVAALTVALTASVLGGCGTSQSTDDATVTACTVAPGGGQPTAEGTVLNDSSEESTFVVRVSFYDGSDNRVSEGVANVGDVAPGATGTWNLTGVTSTNQAPTCKVTSLNRTSIIQD